MSNSQIFTDHTVAVYGNHEQAEAAIKKLSSEGCDIRQFSIIGQNYSTEEQPVGFIKTGKRMLSWGKYGAFWGSIWGLFLGSTMMFIPGLGTLMFAGWLVGLLEGAVVGGGLAALAGALASIGIPDGTVIEYQQAIKAGSFLVMAHGDASQVGSIRARLEETNPARLDTFSVPVLAGSGAQKPFAAHSRPASSYARAVPANRTQKLLVECVALAAMLGLPALSTATPRTAYQPSKSVVKGVAAVYPWSFQNGHGDSHKLAMQSAEEVARRAGYASAPRHNSSAAWKSEGFAKPAFGHLPSSAQLEAFGKSMHVRRVLYGSVSWHTRSIWVDLGPRTISTATVDVYVFDVAADRVVYKKKNVHGRSDEKENLYKDAADVLFTPLVTAVSGGPATPQEQRAAQIALGRGYHDWALGLAK